MKKTLLFLCISLLTVGIYAQSTTIHAVGDYTGNLFIALGGEVDPADEDMALPGQAVALTAGSQENTVSLKLFNFSLDGSMVLGDIQILDIPVTTDTLTGAINFGEQAPVELTLLPGTPSEIKATAQLDAARSILNGTHLTARLNVVWTNSPIPGGMPIDVLFEGNLSHYQIPNSDFELWSNDNEPYAWHSFKSAGGDLAWAASMTTKNTTAVEGRSGLAFQIRSANVFIANANGNITTGRINMGSMTPTDAKNYNYTDTAANSEFNLTFNGIPDSVAFYARFAQPETNTNNARGMFLLHGDYPMKDPTPESEAEEAQTYLIASGNVTVTRASEWTRFAAPVEYQNQPEAKMYMLASFTTNPLPGGTANDTLQVDDVAFIYNSKLASLSVDGTSLTGFDKDTYTYYLTQDYSNEAGYVTAEADGKGATVEVAYNDAEKKIIVTVKGNDYIVNKSNVHTYTLCMGTDPDAIGRVEADKKGLVDVYSLDGICLRRGVKASEATKGLRKGNYVINGEKVNVR